jgi:hypothetical protein
MAGQYDSNTIVSIINSSDDYSWVPQMYLYDIWLICQVTGVSLARFRY